MSKSHCSRRVTGLEALTFCAWQFECMRHRLHAAAARAAPAADCRPRSEPRATACLPVCGFLRPSLTATTSRMMEADKSPTDGLFPTNYQPTRSQSLWSSQPESSSSGGAAPAELGLGSSSHQPQPNSHRRKLSLNLTPGSFSLASSQPSSGEGSHNPFGTIRSQLPAGVELGSTPPPCEDRS